MADYWSTSDVDLHLDVDPATGRRTGLERALRAAIRDGRLAAGTRLPSTRTLAVELGLARGTVSAAYDQLIAEGHLVARRGSGTRVAEHPQVPDTRSPFSMSTGLSTSFSTGGDRLAEPPRRLRHDLRPGAPDVSRFPTAAWLRASRRALNAAPSDVFGYGDPRGRIELRTALADYLGRARGVLTTPDRIIVTSGVLQGLSLLGTVLAADGPARVAMEDPYIPLFREAVRRTGPRIVPLPVDDQGARIADLPGLDADAAVVTPSHQYPVGSTLHPERRQRLAEWARAGRLVVEDDYDGEFRYDRQPVGAIQGMAPDHVVYLGTTAKTLGPGLRLAWMVLPDRLVGPVAEAKLHADHQGEALGQITMAEFIAAHDYDRHIRAGRLRYRRRRDLLADRLKSRAGRPLAGFALGGIAAGLHALVRLEPAGMTEEEVVARAAGYDLEIEGLSGLWHEPGPRAGRPQGIVVGFGSPSEAAYPAALDALVRTLSWS